MLRSIASQKRSTDEVLLVGDVTALDKVTASFTKKFVGFRPIYCQPGHDWGNAERNYVLNLGYAFGTHVVFGDDDDAFLPGAVEAIHAEVDAHPHKPIMFKMVDANGAVLWMFKELVEGNQGTPMFVVPNDVSRLGRFSDRYEGDFDFMRSTLALYGPNDLIWSERVIYGCRSFGNLPNPQEVRLG